MRQIGRLLGPYVRCPKCNSRMLVNQQGDRWCSIIYCDYKETNDGE